VDSRCRWMPNGGGGNRFCINVHSLESAVGGEAISDVARAEGAHRAKKRGRKNWAFCPHLLTGGSEKYRMDITEWDSGRVAQKQRPFGEDRGNGRNSDGQPTPS
jgi:hypothetical protein